MAAIIVPLPFVYLICVHLEENKQQNRKTPKSGTTIGEKRQRYANSREYANNHRDVDKKVDEQYRCDAISVDAAEFGLLSFGEINNPDNQTDKQRNDDQTANKAPFFANGRKNVV